MKRIMSFLFALLLLMGSVSVPAMEVHAAGVEKVYTFNDVAVANQWGVTSEVSADGVLDITFDGQYQSQFYNIPSEIDPATISKVTFNVTEGNAADLAFKLHTQADYDSTNKEGTPVSYGNPEIIPTEGKEVLYFSIMSLNGGSTSAKIADVTFELTADVSDEPKTFTVEENEEYGENVIINGNFDTDDFSAWTVEQGAASFSTAVSDTPIFNDVTTYAAITNRTLPSDCFAQDITDVVEPGHTYEYRFYAMLSDDYEGAPANQRQVDFAPYIVSGGSTTYLGSYSAELSGSCSQQLTPGKWTEFTGKFKVASSGSIDKVVIRLLEQGTDYGAGICVLGDYYVTGVSLRDMNIATGSIEKNIPNLKDTFVADFDENEIAGVSVVGSELNDKVLMELVTKHFNAVTLGNELKPDAMFGYSNGACPGTTTDTLNGEEITVPNLNFSRAEQILDYIVEWNANNPDDQIKVRGHVLVWHSQTPEWFFHEDYNKNNDYVSAEEMNKRLEWYIKSVLEHFTGEDSKYNGLFYGWDVVNEAVSDSTGTYRSDVENGNDSLTDDTHGSKSSWWKVYQSNEFIINAFRYANKYAPADLELYYNDYNDSTPSKVGPICELLKAVKDAEGTRIDGMGMQGHYDLSSPTMEQFEDAARAYADIVGKVQLTELDIKASADFDGTELTMGTEYTKQAYRYKEIYDSMKKLQAEGVEFDGMTVWGVIDPNSWLQGNAGVGGGADGLHIQCPLLFDGAYKAKPSFWAFVDPSKLEPLTKTITMSLSDKDAFAGNLTYTFGQGDVEVEFTPIWREDEIQVLVNVKDASEDADDAVTVYIDKYNSKATGITPKIINTARSEGTAIDGGYQVTVSIPMEELEISKVIGFDMIVTNGSEKIAFNDTTLSADNNTKYYAEAVLKPFVSIPKGTVNVDGEKEEAWNSSVNVPLTINLGAQVTASADMLWDEENLYVYFTVEDAVLNKNNEEVHQQDSIEVFIDELNSKSSAYGPEHKQYRVNYENALSFNGEKCLEENITSFAKTTDNGYVVEAAFKWTEVTPMEDTRIGLELQINDADASGMRIGTLSWYDESGQGWSNPGVYGVAELTGEGTAVSNSEPVADVASDDVDSDEGAVSDQTAAVIAVLLLGGSSAAIVAQRKKKAGEANKESDKKDETKEEPAEEKVE